jgi:hypothetical protein
MREELVRQTLTRLASSSLRNPAYDSVQFLACILVPLDGMALFLFRSSSAAAIRECGLAAEIPFDRIVESVYVGNE